MKNMFGLMCVVAIALTFSGCGDSGTTSSVMDNAEQSAVEEYEALIEAQAAEMDADPPSEQLEAPIPLPKNPVKE